jgi:predicted nucleic acid-binding protein
MRAALDTNILVYAEGVDDHERQAAANRLLSQVPRELFVISVQVLGELFNVLTRRNISREHARARIAYWRESLSVHENSCELMDEALDFATDHKVSVWDSLILVSAADARCDLLISEDFQEGFGWKGVTIVNPFAVKRHRLLIKLLGGQRNG